MAHLEAYLRLLDADAESADWREAASILLELDVVKDPEGGEHGRVISCASSG